MYMELQSSPTDVSFSLSYHHTPSMLAKSTFFYVQTTGHYICSRDYCTKREGYRSFLLLYTCSGSGHAHYRGKDYLLQPHQVFFIDCYDYQEYGNGSDESWDIKWVHFHGMASEGYHKILYENYGPVITVAPGHSVEMHMDALMELQKMKDLHFEIKANSLITQILTELFLSASVKPADFREIIPNHTVEAALAWIESNYSSDIQLEDLSNAACSSVYHFIRVFKKATGYSPYEYIIKYRINKAKVLLKTTGMTVDSIAGAVGFKSTSSFIQTFRKLEDMTPLKYRRFWT